MPRRSSGPTTCPIVVHATGGLEGGTIRQPGHVSSQFLSGLLLTAPLMHRGLVVELTSELVSKPYVDLTIARDAVVRRRGPRPRGAAPAVPAGDVRRRARRQRRRRTSSPRRRCAAAACASSGSARAARRATSASSTSLARMGAEVERRSGLRRGPRAPDRLHGVDVDLGDMSDTAPTLAVRRRVRVVADAGARHRVHPPRRRPTASPPSSPSSAGAGSTPRRRTTASSSGPTRRRCTAPPSRPTTTTAWR